MANPPFHVAAVGSSHNKFTLITRTRRTFYVPEGTRCIVEGGMQPLLSQWLASASGDVLAEELGVDENRISNLRKALGVSVAKGGMRNGDWRKFEPVPLPTNQLKLVGSWRSAVLIVSATPTAWSIVPTTQVIYDSRLRKRLVDWLEETTIPIAAGVLGLNPKRIQAMRRYLGVLRAPNTDAIIV
jgi:hypothetical protein